MLTLYYIKFSVGISPDYKRCQEFNLLKFILRKNILERDLPVSLVMSSFEVCNSIKISPPMGKYSTAVKNYFNFFFLQDAPTPICKLFHVVQK